MVRKLANVLSIGLLLIALAISGVCQTREDKTQGADREQARRFWDAVIRAKGGRERLHQVNNLLVSNFRPEKRDKVFGEIGDIHLFVFPNKSWLWSYAGPFPSPLIDLYTGDNRRYYGTDSEGTEVVTGGDPQRYMEEESIIWLLETKWFRPEPVRVTRQHFGKQRVDVIETTFDGERFDFAVDIESESLMVVRISEYGKLSEHKTKPMFEQEFKDFVAIDGIQMPQSVALFDEGKTGTWHNLQFRFNVDYDPHLFDGPQPISAGRDAWRPKSNNR